MVNTWLERRFLRIVADKLQQMLRDWIRAPAKPNSLILAPKATQATALEFVMTFLGSPAPSLSEKSLLHLLPRILFVWQMEKNELKGVDVHVLGAH